MLVFSSGFCLPISGNVREARAPKLLHVGRRPSRIAHPAVGDPGSKGRRVAWTTSFAASEAGETEDACDRRESVRRCIDAPAPGSRMERPTMRSGIVQPAGGRSLKASPFGAATAPLHNPEVREQRGDRRASSSTGERSSHKREVAGSSPASPMLAAPLDVRRGRALA